MGLPASQRRILERIEHALRGSDPRLAALFSIFSRLNRDEEMPAIEQLRARAAVLMARIRYRAAKFGRWFGAPARARLRAALFFPVALAIVASAVLVGARFPSANRCATPSRPVGAAHTGTGTKPKLCEPVVANPAVLAR
ncbi:MAG TPA: hypothetical protein VMI33_03855 [Streptosporangiaceae bacterium]|nr:hypothetical protein [Streptosporangiaceae bacterium]